MTSEDKLGVLLGALFLCVTVSLPASLVCFAVACLFLSLTQSMGVMIISFATVFVIAFKPMLRANVKAFGEFDNATCTTGIRSTAGQPTQGT